MKRKVLLYMEVPNAHLDDFHPVLDGHFCIASKCLQDARYFEWFKNRPPGRCILDNGTHEERKPVSCADLIAVAEAVKPDLVFAPDILCDSYATLDLSSEFIHRCRVKGYSWHIGIVPQGSDTDDLVRCYRSAVTLLDSRSPNESCIGLSLMDNRGEFLRGIQATGGYSRLPHHMLGLRWLDEISEWPDAIVSMDTVKPLKAAMHNLPLETCPRGLGVWDSRWVLNDAQMRLCYRNIALLHTKLTR